MEHDENKLVPHFMPSLAAMLKHSEDEKGAPLTETEVIGIRDNATCMMVSASVALALEATRGKDIDPENCWEEWCLIRKEF